MKGKERYASAGALHPRLKVVLEELLLMLCVIDEMLIFLENLGEKVPFSRLLIIVDQSENESR